MAAGQGFESLRIYQLSEQLADAVWNVVSLWKGVARDTVGKQMIRSADSVGANIAEGTGRGTYRDNCRFVDNARGSLYETRHWLRRAFNRKLLQTSQIQEIRPLIEELSPKLNASRNSLRRRTSNK